MTFDLARLKPGDEVAISGGGPYNPPEITTVERITPKGQIVLANGCRVAPQGRLFGDHFGRSRWLTEPTDKTREVAERHALVNNLRGMLGDWQKLPTPTLLRIKAALEKTG